MSALDSLASGAGGAVAGQLWKIATLSLAAVLLAVVSSAGTGWWMASASLGEVKRELKAERASNVELRSSLALQNSSLEVMAAATKAAADRRAAAERMASTAIQSATDRLAAAQNSSATSCDAVLREAWDAK